MAEELYLTKRSSNIDNNSNAFKLARELPPFADPHRDNWTEHLPLQLQGTRHDVAAVPLRMCTVDNGHI